MIAEILAIAVALVGTIVLALIAAEARGQTVHRAQGIVRRAARRLPPSHREIYAEEWSALLADMADRPLSAMYQALTIRLGVRRLAADLGAPVAESADTSVARRGSDAGRARRWRQTWLAYVLALGRLRGRRSRWALRMNVLRAGFALFGRMLGAVGRDGSEVGRWSLDSLYQVGRVAAALIAGVRDALVGTSAAVRLVWLANALMLLAVTTIILRLLSSS